MIYGQSKKIRFKKDKFSRHPLMALKPTFGYELCFSKALFVNFVAIGHKNIMLNIYSLLKLVKILRKDATKTVNSRNHSLYIKQQSMRKQPFLITF